MDTLKTMARLLTIIPLLIVLTGTNIYIDPANIYHDRSKDIAEAIAAGNEVYVVGGNLNEREVKRNLIMVMPDETDCIAVGPSLVMCVNKDIVGTQSFINLGVSGADLYDILAQFGFMDIYGKTPKRVIFCVDSYFFNEHIYAAEERRSVALMQYSEYMLSILNNKVPEQIKEDTTNLQTLKTKIQQAFSVTYFQASIDLMVHNNGMVGSQWGIVKDDFDGSKLYFSVDGSLNYAASTQASDINDVLEFCKGYDIATQFAADRHISNYSMTVFEQLLNYLLNQGIEVELFLCPLPPSLWDRVEAKGDHYFILDEITEFADEMSAKYNLKLTGSYNPYDVGISDEGFYDARHVRRELLGVYFDFKE